MINNNPYSFLLINNNYNDNTYDKRFRMKNVPDFNFEKASKNFQSIYNNYYNSLKISENFVLKNKNNFSQFFSDIKKINNENEKDYFLKEIKKDFIISNEMKNKFGIKAYEYYNDYNIMNYMKNVANYKGEKLNKNICIPKSISLKLYKKNKKIYSENNSDEENLLIPLPEIIHKKKKFINKINKTELKNSITNNKNNFSNNNKNNYTKNLNNIVNNNVLFYKDKNKNTKSLNNILNNLDTIKNFYENINFQYFNHYNKEQKIFNKEKIKINKIFEKFK